MPVAALHLSLAELAGAAVELRYWRDDPNDYASRPLDLAEIADLAQRSEADYYAVADADLVTVGRRLYRWLDGADRWLARALESVGGNTVVALAIEARGRLAHLPWETLHDGVSFLVHAANPAVLPVRWKRSGPKDAPPANRALNVLFMATSPLGVQPDLNYEEEEGRILAATQTYPLALTVEETGTLKELGDLIRGHSEGHFDVLHLTGHADHRPDGPRFLTESATGAPEWAAAADIARAAPHRPRLTFLSGCRTGQSQAAGAVPSLAEELLSHGFPAVLGWGRPVFDGNAIVAAAALYDRLASGFTLVEAVLHAHGEMLRAKVRDWHLLRLYVAGATPAAPVTAPLTPGRMKAPPPTNTRRFLGKMDNRSNSVVDRTDFVGRRRPLQRFIRELRGNKWPAGAVVHGLGGVGKSSMACRILDRLEEFEPVVHVGTLDEPAFLRSLEQLSTSAEERGALQGSRDPLRHRLRTFLEIRSAGGRKKVLLVLDDFEQNTPLDEGQRLIRPDAQTVLEALVWAVEQTDAARCLITSRYRLATSQASRFKQEELSAMRGAERDKKSRTLTVTRDAAPQLRQRADRVADGNPRLMERLDLVLGQPGLDHARLLERLEAAPAEFRERLLARELLAGLPVPTRQVLAGLLVYELPVPLEAAAALFPGRVPDEIRAALDAAAALGLVEQEPDDPAAVYRVPRLLEPLLEAHRPGDSHTLVVAAAEALDRLWWKSEHTISEPQTLELLRLARDARRADLAVPVADSIGNRWLTEHRYREARSLMEEAVAAVGRDYRLLGPWGRAALVLGDGEQAHVLLCEALRTCPSDNVYERSSLAFHLAGVLVQRGQPDEALRILRDEVAPVIERLEDERPRALMMGRIADILQARGQLDEALRIRREEELPVYERLGDVRERAVTMGRIADVLQVRGQLDEALCIRREEELPVYERLGDVRSLAVTMGKIADILQARGQTDEALRILRDEVVPVLERLGDVSSRAMTMGQVADILQVRGQLDEALRVRREEELPVYERLGDVRQRAVTMGKIADVLQARGQTDEALRILTDDVLPPLRQLKDLRWLTQALARLGVLSARKGLKDAALQHLREARGCAACLQDGATLQSIEEVLRGVEDNTAS